jgi:DNA-binding response OmpR family regulator
MFWNRPKIKKKILVVDDEPDVLSLVETRLVLNNYEVITASSGAEAIRKAQEESPDLILLDVLMPDKDGFKVCRQLKDDVRTRDIPVIFLTAKSRKEDALEATWAGGVNYITKPYNPQVLLNKVARALKGK